MAKAHEPRITFTEVSGVNDSAFGKSQVPIKELIWRRGEEMDAESVAENVYKHEKLNVWAAKTTSMTGMAGFQPVVEMGSHPNDGMREGFSKTIIPVEWKDSFKISQTMIEDGMEDLQRQSVEAFMDGYRRTREEYGAGLLGCAWQGANYVQNGITFDTRTADGEFLFSKSHKLAASTATVSNIFADALSYDAIGNLANKMRKFPSDNGKHLDIRPDTIIVPDEWAITKPLFEMLNAENIPGAANFGYNVHAGKWNVWVWPYLNDYITGDTIPWIMMDSRHNDLYGGAKWYERVKLEVRSRIDYDTDANVWEGRARFGAGFSDFRTFSIGGISGGDDL